MRVLVVCPRIKEEESNTFIEMEISNLRAVGVTVDRWFFNGEKKPINYFKAALNLRKFIKSKDFDLVHIHFGQLTLISFLLDKKRLVVSTVHGSELLGIVSADGTYNKILSKIVRFQTMLGLHLKVVKGVVFVSKKLQTLAGLPPSKKSVVIPCGVDKSIFHERDKEESKALFKLDSQSKVIFFPADPGRKVKNFAFLKEVLNELDISFSLIVPDNFNLDQMANAYSAADCVVMTSLHEGSPTVVKEAIMSQVPVVALNVGDVEEMSERFKNIFVVTNKEEFKEKLKYVLSANFQFVRNSNFEYIDAQCTSNQLLNFYIDIVNQH